MKVFLSHSSADKDLARRLARDLRAAGLAVWLDEWEVRVGEEFAQRIEQGLDEVDFVVVLLTRASMTSEWVQREWRRKVQHEARTRRMAVVPVRGEPCEVPDFLAQRSQADVSGGSYPLGLRHLLTILRSHADGASATDADLAPGTGALPAPLPIVVPIALEVSGDLIGFFEPDRSGASRALDELAPRLREALHAEFGFPFPGVRIAVNDTDMPPRSGLVLVDEVPEAMVTVDPGADAAAHLFGALHGVLRRMAASFLDIDVTRRLVDSLRTVAPDLVAAAVPCTVSWFELTDVLRRLVDEAIAIDDLAAILDAVVHEGPGRRDTVMLAEKARHALRRRITASFVRRDGALPVVLLDPDDEALVGRAVQSTSVGPFLALPPHVTGEALRAIRATVETLGGDGAGVPMLVTSPEVRPFLRRLVALEHPSLHVLSRQDVAPGTPIDVVATIRFASSPGPSA